MNKLPGCVFIIDPKKEEIAKKEARRLKIPVVAIVDTNCDPEGVDYIIPANDDAIRSIEIISKAIGDACEEGLRRRQAALVKEGMVSEADEKPAAFVTEKEVSGKGRAYIGKAKKKGEEETTQEDVEKFASAKATHEAKPV